MIGYVKHLDSNANGNRPLKKYTKIWERVSSLINITLIMKLFMVILINT